MDWSRLMVGEVKGSSYFRFCGVKAGRPPMSGVMLRGSGLESGTVLGSALEALGGVCARRGNRSLLSKDDLDDEEGLGTLLGVGATGRPRGGSTLEEELACWISMSLTVLARKSSKNSAESLALNSSLGGGWGAVY